MDDILDEVPYHLHVPIFLQSGSLNLLEPSGPDQACNGIALLLILHELSLDILIPSKGRWVKCVEVVVDCNTLVSQCRCVESHGVHNIARQIKETEVFQLSSQYTFS
jgi:hypothetical protein